MFRNCSIRTRLTLVYTVLFFLALIAFASPAIGLLKYRLTTRIEADLDDKIRGLEGFLQRETTAETVSRIPGEVLEYALTQPEGHLIDVFTADGEVVLRAAPLPHPALTREGEFPLYGKLYRVRASASTTPVEESARELGLLMTWSAPFLVLLIGVSVYWMTRQTLIPVDRMTQAASSISIHNLGLRLPVPAVNDELGRLAGAWNDMLSRLEESVARTRRFTADAAHELRTPLTALRTTAELALRRPREPDEYRQALQQVVAISERMTRLADDLLRLARADEPLELNALESFDLRTVLRSVIDEMAPMFSTKRQEVGLELPDRPTMIYGNPADIRRMVGSIVENATRYTPASGSIEVCLRIQNDTCELQVTDSGPGIPQDSLPHVFERFYRVDESRALHTRGHGLGLAIARQIVLAHHGSIDAASRPQGGACLRVCLPGSWTGNGHGGEGS